MELNFNWFGSNLDYSIIGKKMYQSNETNVIVIQW